MPNEEALHGASSSWVVGVSWCRCRAHLCPRAPLGVSSLALTGPSPPAPTSLSPAQPGEVDAALQRSDSGVESALLYAKAWSKYTKELLVWVERRLAMGESPGPVPAATLPGLV